MTYGHSKIDECLNDRVNVGGKSNTITTEDSDLVVIENVGEYAGVLNLDVGEDGLERHIGL